jgi:uncharacterized protein YecE (DUF72 family)
MYIGQANWSIPKPFIDRFPAQGTYLERYARRLTGVEINSSFYRPHRPQTYAKWAASVPDEFRFALKLPRTITHEKRLKEADLLLETFLTETDSLGPKRGPLLVQLPPSLKFDGEIVEAFFQMLRARYAGPAVCEPRHLSWFTPTAEEMLKRYHIARAAVDPALVPVAAQPGGYPGLVYYRLRGSPRMYYSNYSTTALKALAERMTQVKDLSMVWCIFDNTTVGAACGNALELQRLLAVEAHHEGAKPL